MLWNCIYETGVDILDEQNKELFRRENAGKDELPQSCGP